LNKRYTDEILCGDALEILYEMPDRSAHCCVTSPPYWGLRDYGVEGQLGLEKTPEEYVERLVEIFREVRRVLRDDGTLWLNLGDSYASNGIRNNGNEGYNDGRENRTKRLGGSPVVGLKSKDLVGIPWRVAFALQADGWWLRSDIIWAKPNPMPESVRDRPTKSHEYIFLVAKSKRYYYNQDAIRESAVMRAGENRKGSLGRGPISEPTKKVAGFNHSGPGFISAGYRNKRDVWTVTTKPYKEAHFATFPPGLICPCILAGCPSDGIVLDPFFGAGTTGIVAKQEGRHYIGIELNLEYVKMAKARIARECPMEVLI